MKFYGRENELEAFAQEAQKVRNTGTASMVVVTGRRRIGKTTLILRACEAMKQPCLYFFVQKKYSEKELVSSWLKQIRQVFNIEFVPKLDRLSEVISYVMSLAQDNCCTLVIDECQELDRVAASFWSELQETWDRRKNRSKLLLVMSGSIASAIRHIFADVSEPLYGRADQMMVLRPFGTALLAQIMEDHATHAEPGTLLALYALTGGVARYVELLLDAGARTDDEFLDYVFSEAGSWFRADGEFVLANEFRTDSPVYYQLLHGISHGATKWNELNNLTDVQSTPYLTRLEKQYGLIRRNHPLGREASPRGVRFAISDPYFRFWFRYIEPSGCRDLAERKQWALLRQNCRESFPDFLGRTLEQWFVERYKESGHWMDTGGWWDKKGMNEIDIVSVNPLNRAIEFAEVKLNSKKQDPVLLHKKADAFLAAHPKYWSFTSTFRELSECNMTDPL